MDKNTLIKVTNRENASVIYSIPEMNGLRRVFGYGETKQVTFEELEKLSYIPGGMELLKESLAIIDNDEAIRLLLGKVEPEYFYTKEDIKNLMVNGSLDEFLDCLDFAPEGVKDLIQQLAVELPLNDVTKRKAIYDKLHFDVDSALRIRQEAAETVEEKPETTQRRVQKTGSKNSNTSVRRVVKKEEE
jgi:hypothetical protein